MMRPSKCWIGLLPLLAIWGLANWVKTSPIEADLTQRAGAAVAKAGLAAKSLSVAGRDVTLAGEIFEEAARAPVVAAADAEPGVRLVNADALKGLAVASPYVWAAKRESAQVTLTGSVPNPAVRQRIVAAAKAAAPGAEIIDRMTYAAGAPANFEQATGFALAGLSGLATGETSLNNAGWSIAGQAATLSTYGAILDSGKKLPNGLSLTAMNVQPPIVKPYTWSLTHNGRTMTLEGFAPDVPTLNAAGAAAQIPPLQIVNNLKPGAGLPQGLDHKAATAFAAGLLGKLRSGVATFTDGALSLVGEAYTADRANVLDRLKGALPAGLKLGTVDIKDLGLSPAELQAKAAADAAAKAKAEEEARAKASAEAAAKAKAEEEARAKAVADAAAAKAKADADGLVAWLRSLLKSGTVDVKEGVLSITGEAYTPQLLAILDRLKGALPGGWKLGAINIADLGAPQGATPRLKTEEQAKADQSCQLEFSGVLSRGKILFRTGSAFISDESGEVLDELVRVLRACPNSEVEIAGHTDNVGDPDNNLDLSRRRAQAVVDELVTDGVPASKLSAAGYGETRPVASNETAEGKARNRRIEFVVK